MSCKEIIQLFVPPVYYKVKKRLFPKKQPAHQPLPKVAHERNRMVVIGNGPSLNGTVELYESQLKEADCIMVNFSARTPFFERIMPKYYVIADPGFKTNRVLKESIDALAKDLQVRTKWPMTIIMPDSLERWDGCNVIRENKNIDIRYYNNNCMEVSADKLFEAWDMNAIAPAGQSVLNTAVWLSIYWGYKETYLVGADTSFLEDTHVDQNDNRVYTEDQHFYNNSDVYTEKQLWAKNKRYLSVKYHEEIETIYIILKSYWDLRGYADWKGVKVYNASEYSCIDAFDRKKLN